MAVRRAPVAAIATPTSAAAAACRGASIAPAAKTATSANQRAIRRMALPIRAHEGFHPRRVVVAVPGAMPPGQMQVVAAAVTSIARVSDPPKRRSRLVLPRPGPPREPVDVVPRSHRTGHEIHRQPERVLAAGSVASRRVAGGHLDME